MSLSLFLTCVTKLTGLSCFFVPLCWAVSPGDSLTLLSAYQEGG